MKGWLRKRVAQASLFQREMFPKRHFKVDFTKALVTISKEEHVSRGDKVHEIPFREFTKVILFNDKYEQIVQGQCHAKYRYGFQLESV